MLMSKRSGRSIMMINNQEPVVWNWGRFFLKDKYKVLIVIIIIRYAGGIINWTKKELRNLDTRTRKTLTMNRALNPRDCVASLYVPRAEGGKGLISVEEYIGQAKNSLQNYILHSD